MPIYEYRCGECGYQKEYLQRMSDAPLTDCPECGKRALNKLVTAAGFQLKGTGWYATDFRNGGVKPAAKDKAADGAKPAEISSKEPSTGDAACGTGACPACG
ncbi:MAG: zinc ribbon domain-containing protein [Betaproteobacteria bacterium]|nr:zinc ribbon domain-containing protein [Betaproteobacteria bacterium]